TMFMVPFAAAGIAQILYALPLAKNWGRAWYYSGTIGTAILIIFWLGTRIPSPRTQGGFLGLLPLDVISITQLIFEFSTLLLSIRIIQTERTPSKEAKEEGQGFGAAA